MPKLEDLMSPEDIERERVWAEQLAKTRANLVALVEEGYKLRYKIEKRRALYQKWRQKYGDDRAREAAKVVEAIVVGKSKIEDYRKFVEQKPTETVVT